MSTLSPRNKSLSIRWSAPLLKSVSTKAIVSVLTEIDDIWYCNNLFGRGKSVTKSLPATPSSCHVERDQRVKDGPVVSRHESPKVKGVMSVVSQQEWMYNPVGGHKQGC